MYFKLVFSSQFQLFYDFYLDGRLIFAKEIGILRLLWMAMYMCSGLTCMQLATFVFNFNIVYYAGMGTCKKQLHDHSQTFPIMVTQQVANTTIRQTRILSNHI